jgi:VWFA-related protein
MALHTTVRGWGPSPEDPALGHPCARIRSRLLVACLAAISAQPIAAQSPTDRQAAFRTGVDVVVVEATAVDQAGNAVRGLRAAEFKAAIGGRAREVVSAEFVDYEPAGDSRGATQFDITTNATATSARTVLMVVDQSSLRYENRGVLEGAKRWLASLGSGDRLGFMGVPAPGPVVDFTTDHDRVIAAFDQLGAGASRPAPPHPNRNVSLWEAFQIVERNEAVRAEVLARECKSRDPSCPAEVDANARSTAADSEIQLRPVLDGLRGVLRALAALAGPKHLILVSSGWPIEERRAVARMVEIAEEAARSNVTIHVFTAAEWAMSAALKRVSPRPGADERMLLSSVETLAGYTGGRAVRPVGNGEAAFKSLSGGLAGYYRLAVEPAPEDLDGKSKRIDLEVTRRGVSLTGFRRVLAGALATGAARTNEVSLDAALRSVTPLSALGLSITSYVLHGEASPGSIRVVVAGEVTRSAAGPATVVAMLFDNAGKSVAGTERTIEIPATGLGRIVATVPAPPGVYRLRLAVRDCEGRVGSVERHVQPRWLEAGGVLTTGLVLFRAADGEDSLEPVLAVVSTGDQLIAQMPLSVPSGNEPGPVTFEFYREGEDTPRFWVTARVGTTDTGALIAEGRVPPSVLPPGDYTLVASIGFELAATFRRALRVEAPRP